MNNRGIKCPKCGELVEIIDVTETIRMGKCPKCNHSFSVNFPEEVARDARPPVARPKGFDVKVTGGEVSISWKWYKPRFALILIVGMAWTGVLMFGLMQNMDKIGVEDPLPLMMFITFTGIGGGLIYWALCGFVNETIVTAGNGVLRIEHKPLWWPGARVIKAENIAQLYGIKRVHQNRDGTEYIYYEVMMARKGSSLHQRIVGQLESPDEALYIEQQVEKNLGIVNQRVNGEILR